MIRIGVIGYGYWGPNLTRNFFESDRCWIATVCDKDPERLKSLRKRYPTIMTITDPDAMFHDRSLDAIAIATPVATHFDLAMRALKAGKHVLIEKPMTASVSEAEKLVREARKRKLVLMVDHTFVYSGAVRWIRDSVREGLLGKLYYYDSVRVNLGLFQHDINVVWDLAVHDISIMSYVLGKKPWAVICNGTRSIPSQPESIAYMTCYFEDNFLAHFHVNWLAPAKIRLTVIGGSRRMIVYNDIFIDEKVKLYDKGVVTKKSRTQIYESLVSYRVGDIFAPKLDTTEALKKVTAHFIDCIEEGKKPMTDGVSGLEVVRILEAADTSLKRMGKRVRIAR